MFSKVIGIILIMAMGTGVVLAGGCPGGQCPITNSGDPEQQFIDQD